MIINLFPMGTFDALSLWDKTLANNTPEQIQMAARQGVADKLWAVGDRTAPISIGAVGNMSATSACAFILGFDHNSSIEGNGITFQFGKTTGGINVAFVDSGYESSYTSGTYFNMNNVISNAGGWKSSRMRTVICPAFLNALPSEWQNVISETTKYSDNTGGGSDTASYVTATTDKIFLLAEKEVQGTITYANSAEQNYQNRYAFYANGNSTVKYKHNSTSNICAWWLRSVRASSAYYFCSVNNGGSPYFSYSYYSYGFAPAFRVA